MSNDIKNEFKDFIDKLSTEICKEVLLKELEKINSSLNNTSKKYNELYDNYKYSIEQIKQEISTLESTNENMSFFTDSINTNSKVVNESLEIVKNVQKKVVEDMLDKNKKALENYKIDIQKLNLDERNKFIESLKWNLNHYHKKYIDELSYIINNSKMNQTLVNSAEIKKYFKSTNMEISLLNSKVDEYENTYNKFSDRMINLENQIQLTKKNIYDSNDKLKNQISKLEEEIKSKNKIIIGMGIAILVIILIK